MTAKKDNRYIFTPLLLVRIGAQCSLQLAMEAVTAIGHSKVIMQESKDYYEDWKWGRRLAGLRALATVKD